MNRRDVFFLLFIGASLASSWLEFGNAPLVSFITVEAFILCMVFLTFHTWVKDASLLSREKRERDKLAAERNLLMANVDRFLTVMHEMRHYDANLACISHNLYVSGGRWRGVKDEDTLFQLFHYASGEQIIVEGAHSTFSCFVANPNLQHFIVLYDDLWFGRTDFRHGRDGCFIFGRFPCTFLDKQGDICLVALNL